MKCNFCGEEFIKKSNNVKYCSVKCRDKVYYTKTGAKSQREYAQIRLLNKYGVDNLNQCAICKKWFRQVGSHVVQTHGYESARDYREEYGFDVKKGQLPEDYRKLKAGHVFENGTINNLKVGKKYWFKKGEVGVGKYNRSQQTMERLKVLCKFNLNKQQ